MSELKAIDDLYERRIRNGSDPYKIKLVDVRHPPVYLKSEADKVIAELKDNIETANQIIKASRELLLESQKMHKRCADNAVKIIRHHKYKRCINEAKICQLCIERYERYLSKRSDCDGLLNNKRWKFLKTHYEKWYECWMELAEKFKEAK